MAYVLCVTYIIGYISRFIFSASSIFMLDITWFYILVVNYECYFFLLYTTCTRATGFCIQCVASCDLKKNLPKPLIPRGTLVQLWLSPRHTWHFVIPGFKLALHAHKIHFCAHFYEIKYFWFVFLKILAWIESFSKNCKSIDCLNNFCLSETILFWSEKDLMPVRNIYIKANLWSHYMPKIFMYNL